jgi:DNA mismatch endonuclease (patch repair protein)
MDVLTPEQRHKNMKAIKGKNTGIEVKLRKELWSRGLRYQKNCKGVPGKPDIVFKGKKVAVFCDSEFWHGKDWDEQQKRIGTNRDYWVPKIEHNIEHDRKINEELEADGWTVIRFWGTEIEKETVRCADEVEEVLRSKERIPKGANCGPKH